MSSNLPRPEDYIVNYSPLQEAELLMWVVNERPADSLSVRGLARKIRNFIRQPLTTMRDENDLEAESAWQTIRHRWGSVTPDTIDQFLTEKYAQTDHLRKFEYAFFSRCLARSNISKNTIVDMGGGHSYSTVVPMLFRFPNTRILSIDVVNHSRLSKHNVEYIKGDCIHTNLPNELADVVALISTLEHIGLGRWGDPHDVDGDIKAMREAWRILRPGGHVVLTIPYGFPTVVYNLHRVYDAGRVSKLIDGFDIIHSEYSMFGNPAAQSEIEGAKLAATIPGFRTTVQMRDGVAVPDIPGGAMYLLQKKATT